MQNKNISTGVRIVLLAAILKINAVSAQTHWTFNPANVGEQENAKVGTLNNRSLRLVTRDSVRLHLDSTGVVRIKSKLVNEGPSYLSVGNNKYLTVKMKAGSDTTPSDLRFGTLDNPNGNENSGDGEPDYYCSTGINHVNSFSSAIVVNKGAGNVLLGHNGAHGIIDVGGTGTVTGNPGDLLINARCTRNVFLFGHHPISAGSHNYLYVNGKLQHTVWAILINQSLISGLESK
jgi:hypothetical protein